MQIDGNTFLITGGSSGLGAACARHFAAAGARLVLCDRDAAAGAELADQLGDDVRFVEADVCNESSVSEAVAAAEKAGTFSGVVHCAGVATAARIVGRDGPCPLDAFRRTVEVNLVGTFNVLRLAAAALANSPPGEDGERGVVVITASAAAYDGQIGQAAYAASKAGVVGLTLPAARELGRHGIRVVAIAPGVFNTPMMAAMPTAAREALADQVPFPQRLGEPPEFAALVAHIVGNRMINAATVRLDGGLRMASR